MPSLVEWGMVI